MIFGTLLCLRRGRVEQAWNRCALGQEQAPLLEEERQREASLLRCLRRFGPQRLLTSDLRRASGTADRLGEQLDVPLGLFAELREQAFGRWQGRPWAEILEDEQPAATAFLADFTRAQPPGGESLEDVRERVVAFIRQELLRHKRQVVGYVGHAGPIRCLVAEALGLELHQVQRLRLDPFSLTVIRFEGPRSTLELLNYPAAGEHPAESPSE